MLAAMLLAVVLLPSVPASALEAIVIGPERNRIDVTLLGELYEGRGDRLSVETAPGPDGISGRMSVSAITAGTNPNWVVFALNNPTDHAITLWLTAERYDIVGSRVFWPDLDAPRLANVTPSLGFKPARVDNEHADIYRLSIEPGATVTYIVELSSVGFPRLYLSPPGIYGQKLRDLTLFNGILLGIAGLLALFLTAIFAANHKMVFPATALVAWSVLAYLCVDFGFWHKLFKLQAEDNAIYRAATEAAIAASLVVFLYAFLRLRLWHGWIAMLFAGWVAGQLALVGFSVIDANLAAGLARLSYVPIAGIGSLLIVFLALRGQERALSLLPTWMLFLVWLFGAGVTIQGQLSGDVVVSGLTAGLVLLVALLGFTVTQFAFHSTEPVYGEDAGQFQLRVLALEASGASVWEWNTRRDDIYVSPEVDAVLGHAPGTLRGSVEDWLHYLHSADRERLRLILWTIRERQGGEINTDFRLLRADGSYLWFELRAQSIPSRQSRVLRCVGLLRDITSQRRAQERLLRNAVHDSLTGLPNRDLFIDRMHCAMVRAQEDGSKPTVLFIDIDTSKGVSRSGDLVVSDSMLLTTARRLSRHVGPQDAVGRIGSEQFAILLATETEPRHIALLAERVRRSLRSPMKIGGQDMVLTGSVGIAVYDGMQSSPEDLLREAEAAMYRAKRSGADRIELFKPEMRSERDDREALEKDLRQAIERRQIRVLYQPIMRLDDEQLAGFEALIRWDHPKLGALSAAEFAPIAEETGLIAELSAYVMERASRQVLRWHRALPREEEPLFVSVNISSRQLFRQELVQELRMIIGREAVPKGCLRLEVAESLIMENPEHAVEIFDWLKGLGAGLSLDDFGAGYSSLSYLHRLPVDTIKIDRSLVSYSDGKRASGQVVLRAALAMARELGKDVVAVGVEREDDVAYVRALGCEYAQGFYYGEAMTEREVMSILGALAKNARREERRGRKSPTAAIPEPELRERDEAPEYDAAEAPVPSAMARGAVGAAARFGAGAAMARVKQAVSLLPSQEERPPQPRPQAPPPPPEARRPVPMQAGSSVGAAASYPPDGAVTPGAPPHRPAAPARPRQPAPAPAPTRGGPQSLRSRLSSINPFSTVAPGGQGADDEGRGRGNVLSLLPRSLGRLTRRS